MRAAITIAIALALAILPPWISPDAVNVQMGLLLGLLGLCAGLLVEQYLRYEDLADAVRSSAEEGSRIGSSEIAGELSKLTPLVGVPDACWELIEAVARDWKRIDRHGDVPFFREIRGGFADEFIDRMDKLAAGAITVGIGSPATFRASSLAGLLTYRTVTIGSLDFWTKEFAHDYLQAQRRAIADGLVIDRIFVFFESELATAREVVVAHAKIGVRVSVVIRDLVKRRDLGHLIERGLAEYSGGIKMLVQLEASAGGDDVDNERLSIAPADIARAEESLRVLRHYASKIEKIYGNEILLEIHPPDGPPGPRGPASG
ncbi:MAG: hypothetical protein L0Y54_22940 [Sporichthyaceae bacterium]|nr:hypothetical protein [Sporichthyaceae bacterium]